MEFNFLLFIIFISLWVLGGFFGIWCTVFTYRKIHYQSTKTDFFKTYEFQTLLIFIGLFSPILLLGGWLILLSLYADYPESFTIYFKIPKE